MIVKKQKYVVVAGSFLRAGDSFKVGDEVELTDDEAARPFYKKRVALAGVSAAGDSGQVAKLQADIEHLVAEVNVREEEKLTLASKIADQAATIEQLTEACKQFEQTVEGLENELAKLSAPPIAPPKPPSKAVK